MTFRKLSRQPYIQILSAILAGFLLGSFYPETGIAMRPLGVGFIKLIKMVVPLIIFCTLVVGIAGMEDLKKVGKTGGYALLYFEIVTTLALIAGMLVITLIPLGSGLNVDPKTIDTHGIAALADSEKVETLSSFLLNMIPDSAVGAFTKGNILQVLLFSILFGFALNKCRPKGKLVFNLIEKCEQTLFSLIRIIMKVAPIGAFGAIAYTIGSHGLTSMIPLGGLLLVFYLTSVAFVAIVLGIIAKVHAFSLWKLLHYFHEEFLIVLGTSSSDAVLPSVMAKMEKLGIKKPAVGLIVPTGFSFNMTGTSIYLAMTAIFIAQATNTELTWMQQVSLFGVLMLTSKSARGIVGTGFVVLAATLYAVDIVPVAGLALVFGIDRFMSLGRALLNLAGNCVATLVIAKWSGDLDIEKMQSQLDQPAHDNHDQSHLAINQ